MCQEDSGLRQPQSRSNIDWVRFALHADDLRADEGTGDPTRSACSYLRRGDSLAPMHRRAAKSLRRLDCDMLFSFETFKLEEPPKDQQTCLCGR